MAKSAGYHLFGPSSPCSSTPSPDQSTTLRLHYRLFLKVERWKTRCWLRGWSDEPLALSVTTCNRSCQQHRKCPTRPSSETETRSRTWNLLLRHPGPARADPSPFQCLVLRRQQQWKWQDEAGVDAGKHSPLLGHSRSLLQPHSCSNGLADHMDGINDYGHCNAAVTWILVFSGFRVPYPLSRSWSRRCLRSRSPLRSRPSLTSAPRCFAENLESCFLSCPTCRREYVDRISSALLKKYIDPKSWDIVTH